MRVIDLKGFHDGVANLAFTADGTQLIVQTGPTYSGWCDSSYVYHRIDPLSGEVKTFQFPTDGLVYTWSDAVFSPDGQMVASYNWAPGGAPALRLLPLAKGGFERAIRAGKPGDRIAWVAFAPDGTVRVALSRRGGSELLRLHPDRALAIRKRQKSPTSPYPILDGLLEQTARLTRVIEPGNTPALSRDGRIVALWPEAGPPLVVETEGGQILCEMPWPGRAVKQRRYHSAALSPDVRRVAFVGGGLLLCGRIDGQGKPWRAKKPIGYVTSAVFLPDGHTLLAVDRKGCAHHLDETGRVLESHCWGSAMLMRVAVSPDGMLAAAGRLGGEVVLWDLD